MRFELPSQTVDTVEPSSEYTRPETVMSAAELSQATYPGSPPGSTSFASPSSPP